MDRLASGFCCTSFLYVVCLNKLVAAHLFPLIIYVGCFWLAPCLMGSFLNEYKLAVILEQSRVTFGLYYGGGFEGRRQYVVIVEEGE